METPPPLPAAAASSSISPRGNDSPLNLSKPTATTSSVREPMSVNTAVAAQGPTSTLPANHQFWPLGIFSIVRRDPVKEPRWLALIRIAQFAFANVVVGCLFWVILYDDFDKSRVPTVMLFVCAWWTIVPTSILTTPFRGPRGVLDPRCGLLADAFACVSWGITFAAYVAVRFTEQHTFWATGEAPSSARRAALATATSELAITPSAVTLVPLDFVKRALMPHRVSSLSARGVRLDNDGLVSNHDATAAWDLGLIACFLGLAEFLLYALTTTIFAYYYHCAFVADTAALTVTNTPLPTAAAPATTKRDEESTTDTEAARGESFAEKKVAADLSNAAQYGSSPMTAGIVVNNDSGIFGVGDEEEIGTPLESTGLNEKSSTGKGKEKEISTMSAVVQGSGKIVFPATPIVK